MTVQSRRLPPCCRLLMTHGSFGPAHLAHHPHRCQVQECLYTGSPGARPPPPHTLPADIQNRFFRMKEAVISSR